MRRVFGRLSTHATRVPRLRSLSALWTKTGFASATERTIFLPGLPSPVLHRMRPLPQLWPDPLRRFRALHVRSSNKAQRSDDSRTESRLRHPHHRGRKQLADPDWFGRCPARAGRRRMVGSRLFWQCPRFAYSLSACFLTKSQVAGGRLLSTFLTNYRRQHSGRPQWKGVGGSEWPRPRSNIHPTGGSHCLSDRRLDHRYLQECHRCFIFILGIEGK